MERVIILSSVLLMSITISADFVAFNPRNKLSWNQNTEADLAGYKVYCGKTSKVYGTPLDVKLTNTPASPSVLLGDLGFSDGTYYCAVTAYDTNNNESGFSNEVRVDYDGTPPSNPIRWLRERVIEWWRL